MWLYCDALTQLGLVFVFPVTQCWVVGMTQWQSTFASLVLGFQPYHNKKERGGTYLYHIICTDMLYTQEQCWMSPCAF